MSNLAGDRDWTDPAHWITTIDPNYFIIGPNGQLVNGVPNDLGLQKNGTTGDFGEICFQNSTTSQCRNTATGQQRTETRPIGTTADNSDIVEAELINAGITGFAMA